MNDQSAGQKPDYATRGFSARDHGPLAAKRHGIREYKAGQTEDLWNMRKVRKLTRAEDLKHARKR